jgi:hypothetical protein
MVEIDTDDQLARVQASYIARREPGFIQLADDLAPDVFGQTVRLVNRQLGELPFVSIIDRRGEKKARACFTEWHEYSHLLVVPNAQLQKFQRSHAGMKPPEEQLMDAIAGRVGFYSPLLVRHLPSTLTFAGVQATRDATCATASWTSLFTAIGRVWPTPVITIRAEMRVKAALAVPPGQTSLSFFTPPPGELRAKMAIGNGAARHAGFRIHQNMRVPQTSAITQAYTTHDRAEQHENLSDWESSDGGPLDNCPVYVIARAAADGVDALVITEA